MLTCGSNCHHLCHVAFPNLTLQRIVTAFCESLMNLPPTSPISTVKRGVACSNKPTGNDHVNVQLPSPHWTLKCVSLFCCLAEGLLLWFTVTSQASQRSFQGSSGSCFQRKKLSKLYYMHSAARYLHQEWVVTKKSATGRRNIYRTISMFRTCFLLLPK